MARTVEFITRTVKSTTIIYKCANLSDDTITTESILYWTVKGGDK